MVVIVGHRCGWIPAVSEGGDGEKSITRLEVEWALATKRIPVYAYVIDPSFHWAGEKEQDRLVSAVKLTNPEERARASAEVETAVRSLLDFKDFLSRLTRERFTTADDLASKVATDLARWIQQQRPTAGHAVAPETTMAVSPAWTGSPFPGLRAFTPADAPIFFGRQRETDMLVAALCDSTRRFILIAGASGSGKSSLVAAGLIPRLKAGDVPGSDAWLLPDVNRVGSSQVWHGLRFTPGELSENPFDALAAKLAPLVPGAPSPREVARAIEEDPPHLVTLIESALAGAPPRAETLLFIDQFEELITIVTDDTLQGRFIDALAAAAQSPRVRIVGTVRNDFYHRCVDAHPTLAELLGDRGTVPLAIPGLAALRAMIDGPAKQAGLRFDEGLVDDLAAHTVSQPGGLALLAFALHELYERRSNGLLSTAEYDGLGGLTGAISRRATTTYETLSSGAKRQVGFVFGQLVLVDESGIATRRRARRDDVAGASDDARAVVDAFEHARLLVSDAAGGATVLEVAHEALLREWDLLATWIRERAGDLRLLQQVDEQAWEWDRHRRAPHYGWAHERLLPVYDALARLGRRRDHLPDPQRSFLRPEWEWLVEELEKPDTTHPRRAAIGDRLAQLGDPRPGVGLRPDGTPDIVWCAIPAGSVTLEGAKGTFEVAPFSMSKYPVTYRQYKAFLDHPEGYRASKFWKGLEHNQEPGEQYRAIDNHPAENVSWYDATAFCRWLSSRLGFDVRLPHESEWQQAATSGNAAYVYPWGPEWLGNCANTWESRLSRTTAVGVYPHGASAQQVFDLSGNVWEWCQNQNDPSSRKKDAERVLRGGSWNDDPEYARAALRGVYGPDIRTSGIGFRVVCVSPIS
jgi:hypothetical protein